MYDEDLLQAIRATMPRQRPAGFGVTASEMLEAVDSIDTERKAVYRLKKKVQGGELKKERMYDFDGTIRTVYFKDND